jgi:hypothetical protein
VKERILRGGFETGFGIFCRSSRIRIKISEEKWDPDTDKKKIVSDPQH